MAKSTQQGFKPQSTSPAEWVVAAIGAVVIVVTVGALIYFQVASGSPEPTISITGQKVEHTRGGYLVTFRVRNEGHTTAAHLHVRGELVDGKTTLETDEVTFDYVPAFSSRSGGVFFTHDPAKAELRLRATSFVEP